MKKLILMFLILPAYAFTFAFAGQVRVSVTDKELDFPLEGAKIQLEKDKKNGLSEEIVAFADEEGNAVLTIPDSFTSGTLTATLPGYNPVSVKFSDTDSPVEIAMSIAGVIEGKELVVNRSMPESTEEKTGVSTVITKEEMKATSNIGIVEDCMASVRTLPGVSYSGAWGSEPSVRGGEPRELACLLDGMYLLFPYQWGGGTSFFTPAMIESIKLSNGVFSAKYGRASSGLLEATSLKPDFEHFHVNAGTSTTCADGFFQIPFGKKVGGMLLGTHLSYLDPLVWAAQKCGVDSLDMIKRAPYIRNLFLKTTFTPAPELEINLIGMFGSDGLTVDSNEEKKNITTKTKMDYDVYQALGGINVKYLANDRLLFHGILSYNGMFEDLELKQSQSGSVKYNDDFVKKYASIYPSVKTGAGYTLDDMGINMAEDVKNHLVTGRFESEIELTEKNHLCLGLEETFQNAKSKNSYKGWTEIKTPGGYLFNNMNYETAADKNCIFDTAAFLSWTFGSDRDFFQSEIGLRGEFISLKNFDDDYTINLIPDICPRANLTFTPWRNIGIVEKASLTVGSGLFVSIPRETMMFTRKMGLKDFEMNPNRAVLGVLGGDIQFYGGWKLKCESYYKYYLSRIYSYQLTDAASAYKDVKMFAKSNGRGHVFGIDAMIEKKAGDCWDGYLSYSFVYSRLKNPADLSSDAYAQTTNGAPLDEWYFPAYHRFHTFNLVSNWHFGRGWTFTVKGTLATGAPKPDNGNIFCYASQLPDGTVIQRYTRSSLYSDTLRTNISCPVDLKISREWKTNGGKTSWEYYFALQDVFVNLYSPKKDKAFNQYTGEMNDTSESVDFSLGIPIPSFGFKVKF